MSTRNEGPEHVCNASNPEPVYQCRACAAERIQTLEQLVVDLYHVMNTDCGRLEWSAVARHVEEQMPGIKFDRPSWKSPHDLI